MAHIFADEFDGFDAEPDKVTVQIVPGENLFTMDGCTEIYTEQYSLTEERVGNKWLVTYSPANGPKITFETGSRPKYVIESDHPLTPRKCCEGGPQWGHAYNCPTLPG